MRPKFTHGGKRERAGRKPMGKKSGTPHRKRGVVDGETPLMLTMRIGKGLPSLRQAKALKVWRAVLRMVRRTRKDFRVIHYALLSNHIHLLVEGDSTEAVTKGMISLQCRFAKGLNKLLCRKGSVFPDRFHHIPLTDPRQARHALRYVLNNARKHGITWLEGLFDPFSSASLFHGWTCPRGDKSEMRDVKLQDVVSAPLSYLLQRDWYLYGGSIYALEVPGPRRRP